MKKVWEKPVVVKMSIEKLTLSGSKGSTENPGSDTSNNRTKKPN